MRSKHLILAVVVSAAVLACSSSEENAEPSCDPPGRYSCELQPNTDGCTTEAFWQMEALPPGISYPVNCTFTSEPHCAKTLCDCLIQPGMPPAWYCAL